MVRFKIKCLTKIEFFCIDASAFIDRIGRWSKGKRWEIEDRNHLMCPHCRIEQIAPPRTYGCSSCGYEGE